jgi:2'-5' RNA ligase
MPHCDSSPKSASTEHRLFLACVPAPALAERMQAIGRAHRRDARLIPPANLHLTLAFLGSVADARIASCRSAVSALAPLDATLRLDRLGFWRRGGILWLGPSHSVDALTDYANSLRATLRGAGFPVESRPFKVHVTLARKCRQGLRPQPFDAIDWPLRRVDLIVSRLDPKGARYRSLSHWPAG